MLGDTQSRSKPEQVFIIAELGSCHDMSLNNLERLIRGSAEAGASAAKLQYWSDPEEMAKRRNAMKFLDLYSYYRIPDDWLPTAAALCGKYGIELMCTAYLAQDAKKVAPFVSRMKIASFEFLDEELRTETLKCGKPIYISVGMASHQEIYTVAANLIDFRETPDVTFMQCTSSYPSKICDANLAWITRCRSAFQPPLKVGYSDHAAKDCLEMGGLAVAAGATAIEVHVRLEHTWPRNPDYDHSITIEQLSDYIAFIRKAELAMGNPDKEMQPCETEMSQYRVKG